MSRNDESRGMPAWLRVIGRAVERPSENASAQSAGMRDTDPQMRLLEQTQPGYARFLRERQRALEEEVRSVDRANESEAFPSRRRE